MELETWYRERSDNDPRLAQIVVLSEMPMTATGKIDKVTLRQLYGAKDTTAT